MTDNPFDFSGTANAPAPMPGSDDTGQSVDPESSPPASRLPEAAFSYTTKVLGNLLSTRGADRAQFLGNIRALDEEVIAEIHKLEGNVAKLNQTSGANARPAQPAYNNAPPPASVPGTVDPAAPAGSCEHGALVLNEWQWNGKQMRRYQCPVKTANRGKGGCDNKVWADKVEQGMPF